MRLLDRSRRASPGISFGWSESQHNSHQSPGSEAAHEEKPETMKLYRISVTV